MKRSLDEIYLDMKCDNIALGVPSSESASPFERGIVLTWKNDRCLSYARQLGHSAKFEFE